jgi:co-chaperonin GroES (HSP10)
MSNFREIYEIVTVAGGFRPAPDQIIVKPIIDDHSIGDVIDATKDPFGKGTVMCWGERAGDDLDIEIGDTCYYVRGSALSINKDGNDLLVIDSFSVKVLESNPDIKIKNDEYPY